MRLTTAILIASLLQVSASTFGQRITMSQHDVSLESVLKEIRRQSGYDFLSEQKSALKNVKVTVEVHNATVEETLNIALDGLNLRYEINERNITIKDKEKSFLDLLIAKLQQIDVRGRIINKEGSGLAGATITVKGKNQITNSNSSGDFFLSGVDEDATLVISYVGYRGKELKAQKDLGDIFLEESTSELEQVEVVYNTGYQEIRPEHSTGSISVLTAKQYNSRINTMDFLTGLQNKLPGLLINNDVKFEGNGLFQIRGISTIKGNKNPLIVVDGYPTDLTLDMIDPNEIESVTVLRDAAAATIYGARSSNGVIIIERKKAKAGNVQVNLRSTLGFKPKEDYSRYRWDEAGSAAVIEYAKRQYENASPTDWAFLGTTYGYGPRSPAQLIMIHSKSNTDPITIDERDRQFAELASYNNASDYGNLFLRTAATQTYNLDMSGGSDRMLYYLTANYSLRNPNQVNNNDGIFRISGRSTMRLSDRFSLDLTMDLQQSNNHKAPIPNIETIYPFERFQDEKGNPMPIYTGSRTTPVHNAYIKSLGLLDNLNYPLTDMNEVNDDIRVLSNRITANFRYRVGNGFNLSFGGVYELSRTDNRHLASERSTEMRQIINYYTKPGTNGLVYNIPKGSYLRQQAGNTKGYTLRAQADYQKTIATDHSLNLILGAELRNLVNTSNTAGYLGYNDKTLFHEQVDFRSLSTFAPSYLFGNSGLLPYSTMFNQLYVDDRFISGYSNLVYSYKDRYSLTASARVDQSNLFGTDPKYKYKPLWSVGAAWNVNKENFLQRADWLRELKMRAAYGFNGNVAKDALPRVIATDEVNTSMGTTVYLLNLSSLANSGLRWEQTNNFNAGLNYSIFKGISGSIDYYVKKSTDILANNQIDASKGAAFALINQASIRNTGLEFSLQADWLAHRKFNWNTGLVFSRNRSKVLEVYNADLGPTSKAYNYIYGSYSNYLKDYPLGALFSYRYAGLDNQGVPLIYDKDGNKKREGTNQGFRTDVDYEGSSIPMSSIGLSNRVDIGNFYAYCMINYFGGFKTRVPVPNATALRPLEGAGTFWRQPGDEANPDMLPGLSSISPGSEYNYFLMGYMNKYTVRGNYLTLADVTVAYSLRNSKLIRDLNIRNFEIKAQASNVYTVGFNRYNFSQATGSYAKSYLTPTYTVALSLNF